MCISTMTIQDMRREMLSACASSSEIKVIGADRRRTPLRERIEFVGDFPPGLATRLDLHLDVGLRTEGSADRPVDKLLDRLVSNDPDAHPRLAIFQTNVIILRRVAEALHLSEDALP